MLKWITWNAAVEKRNVAQEQSYKQREQEW